MLLDKTYVFRISNSQFSKTRTILLAIQTTETPSLLLPTTTITSHPDAQVHLRIPYHTYLRSALTTNGIRSPPAVTHQSRRTSSSRPSAIALDSYAALIHARECFGVSEGVSLGARWRTDLTPISWLPLSEPEEGAEAPIIGATWGVGRLGSRSGRMNTRCGWGEVGLAGVCPRMRMSGGLDGRR